MCGRRRRDHRVTRQEFIDAVDAGMEPDPQYIEQILRVARVVARAADLDDDGMLDRETWTGCTGRGASTPPSERRPSSGWTMKATDCSASGRGPSWCPTSSRRPRTPQQALWRTGALTSPDKRPELHRARFPSDTTGIAPRGAGTDPEGLCGTGRCPGRAMAGRSASSAAVGSGANNRSQCSRWGSIRLYESVRDGG